MPNFLANLGQGLGRFGGHLSPEFEEGSRFGGGLRDRFKKRPGDPGGSGGQQPMAPAPVTPASATDMLETATAEGENAARSKLAIAPPSENFDMMGELGAANPGPPDLADSRQINPGMAMPDLPRMTTSGATPETLRDYRGRDISSDSIGFARDQYMRGHMQPGGGFKRDWKMTLRNALLGGANARGGGIEGILGGAIAGAAGSLIDPRAGHEVGFELGERPRLEADIRRGREEEAYQRGQRIAGYDESLKRGQVDLLPIQADQERAQTEAMRANVGIAQENARRQQAVADSQIDLNKARAEALRTGKPVYKDIVRNGQIVTVAVFPDGDTIDIGSSGAAEMASRKDTAAMQRTQLQQSGATGRTAMAQAGATNRTQMNIDARQTAAETSGQGKSKLQSLRKGDQGGKTISEAEVQKYAGAKKMTPEKAREHWKSKGFTVTK